MKISCPNCPAAYELDDSRIPPAGLSIKCPKCKAPFTVHKPKPGEEVKGAVKGVPVPLPGQAGPAKPAAPKTKAPSAAAGAKAPVPLPGLEEHGQGQASPGPAHADGAVPLPGLSDAFGDDFAAPPPPPSMPPASRRAAPPASGPAVPLPGLDDAFGSEDAGHTSVDFRPHAPADPGAVPLPGLDDAPQPPAQDFAFSAKPTPAPDFAFSAKPPPPPPPSLPPQSSGMDDIFSVDLDEDTALTPKDAKPRAKPPEPQKPVADEGISFDFVEAPPPSLAAARGAGADMLDFVEDQPAPATPPSADKKSSPKRAPPVIAKSTPGDRSEEALSQAAAEVARGPDAQQDPDKAEKERKKQERKRQKEIEGAEKRRRRAERSERLGPVVRAVTEALRNPRISGSLAVALVLAVVAVLGLRARNTPAGLFWMNKLVPSKKAATAAETKVIEKGMDRLAEGSFAGAREAVGMAAQLSAVLPDDEDVKAFFVLSTSELKLVYSQVGGDWDQAKRVVERMKASAPAQNRARGAYALASGDLAKGKALLTPLGDRANADLESTFLFAQSLLLTGEQAHAAQVLDNALKGKGADSTKLLVLRGLVAQQKNQLPEAAGFFEKALARAPGNGRALVELADVKLRQGDTKATAELLDKALVPEVRKSLDATEEGRASMLRGKLAVANHLTKDAETAYDRAVALDPNSADIREAYGDFRLARREWEKASKQFDAAVASGNASPRAYAGSAQAYLGTNRLLEADKRINEAVAKDKDSAHFIYLQGRVAEAIGKGDEAFKDYERALAKKPDLAEALVAQGNIFLTRGDKDKAREKLELALKVPDAGRTSLEEEAVGELALAVGEKEKGRDAFSRALQKDPEDPFAHSGMGKALAALGQLPEARKELETALAAVDNDASLFYEYGSLLRRSGDSEGALAALQRAVKLDSKDPRFRSRLGAVLVERGDFEQAESQLHQAVLMNDRFAESQFFLARALAGEKKLSEAVETMKKAVEIEPDNAEYLYNLGLIYELGQQVQDAIDSLQKAIDKNPKSADAWEHLGQNLTIENRFSEAVTAFKKAADLDPKRARLWAEVGDSEQQSGDLDGAIRDFQRALAQDSSLHGVWSKLGVAYKDKDCRGCKSKAMDALRRAAQVDPTDAVAHHELGYMYKDDGRRREAIAEFRKYIELKPDAGDLSTVQDDIFYLQEESRRAP